MARVGRHLLVFCLRRLAVHVRLFSSSGQTFTVEPGPPALAFAELLDEAADALETMS